MLLKSSDQSLPPTSFYLGLIFHDMKDMYGAGIGDENDGVEECQSKRRLRAMVSPNPYSSFNILELKA
ncbi:unnamed protein product [Lactuca virosa]|uniref:Uncharacterized protein n=1 Tax=Lactuca virosa TaxID=75947 RepID=A0AAU9P733_9ASTR|nr:unnamed protein product [Lactuca virosa]